MVHHKHVPGQGQVLKYWQGKKFVGIIHDGVHV